MVSSIDVAFMVKELQTGIGSRVDNVYEDSQGILVQLHASGKGKTLLRLSQHGVWMTNNKAQETTLTGFCGLLRKNLRGKKIISIQQQGSERVVTLTIGKESLQLLVQLFGIPNILLCNAQEEVFGFAREQKGLEQGKKFTLPAVHDVRTVGVEEFKKPTESFLKTLTQLGLGARYAQEVITRTQITSESKTLTKKQAEQVITIIKELFAQPIHASIVTDCNTRFAVPFECVSLKSYAHEGKNSFSEALDVVYAPTEQAVQKARKAYDSQLRKLSSSREKQESLIITHEHDAVNEQRKGEVIYEHYPDIKKMLDQFKEARKTHSLKELKEFLKTRNINVNDKNGEITIEVME